VFVPLVLALLSLSTRKLWMSKGDADLLWEMVAPQKRYARLFKSFFVIFPLNVLKIPSGVHAMHSKETKTIH
jgi:hypothetical protein